MTGEELTGPSGTASGSAEEEARAGLVALGVEMGTLAGRFAADTGLHATDVRAMWVMAEPGAPRTAGELGTRLGLSSAAATRAVDRLERSGYVERERDPEDRRRVGLRLTAEAHALARDSFGKVATAVERAISAYPEADLALVAGFLSRVHEAMRSAGLATERRPSDDAEAAGDGEQRSQ